jgi:putative addiction module component (TIGR02574 family)
MKNALIDEVVSLPVDDRAEIVDILLKSLNPSVDRKIEKIWAEEAENRAKSIKENTVQTIPADNVFNNIRRRLSK